MLFSVVYLLFSVVYMLLYIVQSLTLYGIRTISAYHFHASYVDFKGIDKAKKYKISAFTEYCSC